MNKTRDYAPKFRYQDKNIKRGQSKRFKDSNNSDDIVWGFSWDETKHPLVARAGKNYDAANTVVTETKARKKILADTQEYSAKGLNAKLAREIYENEIPSLLKAKDDNQKLIAEIRAKRASLKLPEFDRKDVVGEMQRAELRAMIRAMPDTGDNSRIMRIVGLKRTDPGAYKAMVDAVISAPSGLSGLSEGYISIFKDERMEDAFGPALDELDELEKIALNSQKALTVAQDEMRAEVGLTPNEFDHLTNPLSKEVSRLKFDTFDEEVNGEKKKVVRVLDVERGIWRLPNEQELQQQKDAA